MRRFSTADVAARAIRLRELHHGSEPLVLPNAWDVASARIFEQAGFPAIATTSAGIAFSLGYPDGQRIPAEEMLGAVARIVSAASVPVTADLESGYGDAAATAKAAIAAGAAGLNLEDSENGTLVELRRQTDRIRAVRETGERSGVHLVLNARTDVFLFAAGDPETRVDRAVERLRAYAEAGADSVFAPGVSDEDSIARLARAVDCPLNILAVAGAPPVKRLKELGVRRISIGSGAMRATMGLTRRIAEELLRSGTYSSFTESALSYADANALFQA
jgi:2-methylisocitrate lyase-like PEP mutase family enzyme